MQVAKPNLIQYPIGAIELIDIYTKNSFRSRDFCLFEMEPDGDLEKRNPFIKLGFSEIEEAILEDLELIRF